MAAPVTNHLVSGTLKDRLGDILTNTNVTLTHANIEPVLTTTTGSDGKYIFNLGSLDTEWSVGQEITLTSTVALKGTKSTTVAISSGASQTVNLQLAETSDLVFAENSQNRHNLNFALITNYAGEPYTSLNPVPVAPPGDRNINDPAIDFVITRGDGQPDSETITLANGDKYKRTFTYENNIQISRSRWVKE